MQEINPATRPLLREGLLGEPGLTSARRAAWGAQETTANKRLSPTLTPGNPQRHRHFLHDRPEPREGCKAAIVTPAVAFFHVGKVEISLQAHGDPLVLWDVLQIWQGETIVRWERHGAVSPKWLGMLPSCASFQIHPENETPR